MATSDEIPRIARLLEARKYQYDYCSLSLALTPTDTKPMLLRGAIRFAKNPRPQEGSLEYDSLILQRWCMSPEEGLSLVTNLHSGQLADSSRFRIQKPYDSVVRYESYPNLPNRSNSPEIGDEWPAVVYVIKYAQQIANDPRGPLLKPGLPVASDPRWLIAKWLGVNADALDCRNGVVVILPDFRARISGVRIGEEQVEVKVATHHLALPEVVTKVEVGFGNEAREADTMRNKNSFKFSVDEKDQVFNIYLLNKNTGEPLDWIIVNLGWIGREEKVEFSVPSQQIERLIDDGESESLEFKSEVGNGEEVVESILAFANTCDGLILIGVEDDGAIIGVENPGKEEERILNIVEGKCDPPVTNLKFEHVQIDDKQVLQVFVSKGSNPPYVHRDKGVVYLRRNATDRRARRVELESLFRR